MFSQATSIDCLKLKISRLVAVTKLDLIFYGSLCIPLNRRVKIALVSVTPREKSQFRVLLFRAPLTKSPHRSHADRELDRPQSRSSLFELALPKELV